jgi:hypothetical protein
MSRFLRRIAPPLGIAAALWLAPATATDVVAQAEGVRPKVTQLPGSTRAMALGNAYMMNSGHADALFYHPALLARSTGFGIELQRWGSHSSAAFLSAATGWLGGGIGVGIQALQYGAPGTGPASALEGQDHLFSLGPTPVSERVATLGFARRALADLDVGASIKLVDQRVSASRQSVTLIDIGVAREVGPVVAGLSALDLGRKPIVDTGSDPSRVSLGAGSYGRPVGPLDVGAAATVGLSDGTFTYGGGIEVGYWPIQGRTFVGRIGLERGPEESDASVFTAGLAFWGDDISVEWAFRAFGGSVDEATHRFGLRWR